MADEGVRGSQHHKCQKPRRLTQFSRSTRRKRKRPALVHRPIVESGLTARRPYCTTSEKVVVCDGDPPLAAAVTVTGKVPVGVPGSMCVPPPPPPPQAGTVIRSARIIRDKNTIQRRLRDPPTRKTPPNASPLPIASHAT